MSCRIFSAQELANIAYLTGAEVRDLYIAHVANVNEFNTTYPNSQHSVEPRSEIINALFVMRYESLTAEFIDDTLSAVGLLRYNSDETLADEALTRIEARGFYTYRQIALYGKIALRDQRRQNEIEERVERRSARYWEDGVDDGG